MCRALFSPSGAGPASPAPMSSERVSDLGTMCLQQQCQDISSEVSCENLRHGNKLPRGCGLSILRDIQPPLLTFPMTHPLSLARSPTSIPQNLKPWVSATPSYLTLISDPLSPPAEIYQGNFFCLQGTGHALEGAEVEASGFFLGVSSCPSSSF